MNSTFAPHLLHSASPVARPPAARASGWMARVGRAVWNACVASSEERARRHLLDYAVHCDALQPELAKELRAAARQFPVA